MKTIFHIIGRQGSFKTTIAELIAAGYQTQKKPRLAIVVEGWGTANEIAKRIELAKQDHDVVMVEFQSMPPSGLPVPDHVIALDKPRGVPTLAAADVVAHMIERIQRDPRLAYYMDPLTESFQLLTTAYAEDCGTDVETLRSRIAANMKYEPPGAA